MDNQTDELMDEQMENEIAVLRKEYARELPKKIAAITDSAKKAQSKLSTGQVPDWAELESLLHRIAGSSGTFGFLELSALTRYLEEKICENAYAPFSPEQIVAHIGAWIKTLEKCVSEIHRKGAAAAGQDNSEAALKELETVLRADRSAA